MASPSACAACIRPTDIVARLGGDEFAVLLSSTRRPRATPARAVAERILDGFEPPGRRPATSSSRCT